MLPVGPWMLVGEGGMGFMTILIALFHCWLSALALNATLPAGDGASLSRKKEKRDESAQVEVIGSTRVSHVQGRRTLPSFVLSRDAARGALYSLQASLDYALMLAVMWAAGSCFRFFSTYAFSGL